MQFDQDQRYKTYGKYVGYCLGFFVFTIVLTSILLLTEKITEEQVYIPLALALSITAIGELLKQWLGK